MPHATRKAGSLLKNCADHGEQNSLKASIVARHAANRRAFDRALHHFRRAESGLERLADGEWINQTLAFRRCQEANSRAYQLLRTTPAPDISALAEKVRAMIGDGDAASVILGDLERLAGMPCAASA